MSPQSSLIRVTGPRSRRIPAAATRVTPATQLTATHRSLRCVRLAVAAGAGGKGWVSQLSRPITSAMGTPRTSPKTITTGVPYVPRRPRANPRRLGIFHDR